MNWVKDLANWLTSLVKWWVTVLPWQEGIRVRMGKHETMLKDGMYLKLPIIDTIFIQNIRLRYVHPTMTTLTTKDGKVVTLGIMVGYKITDIGKLYKSIANPDSTVASIATSKVSKFITSHNLSESHPDEIEKDINLDGQEYGLHIEMKIIGFAEVKTYRLIQDQSWMPTHKDYEI